jgi:putative salt-induced outer membrane protein YdiY
MKYSIPLTFLMTSLASFPANAIVNVENMRVGGETPGISGNLDLSINGKRGNTKLNEYGVDGRLQNNAGKVTNFVVLSYDYAEVGDVRNTNKAFIHGRHVVQFQPRRAWEIFAQMEKNEFARLSFRGLLGGGLRFTLTEEPNRLGLYLGVGAFWSRETLDKRPGLTDDGTENFSRANLYLVYKHILNSQLSLVSTTYFQPRLSDTADYRALEQAALAVKMTDSLSLKLSLDFARDSRPPQAVKKNDTSYSTSLSYQF